MYYEEQWTEGALCWRTSPDGAWTRYTANELAHRYESAEKRAADAQATVEALQARLTALRELVGQWAWNTTNLLGDYRIATVADFNAEWTRRSIWLIEAVQATLPPPQAEQDQQTMYELRQQVEALQRERDKLREVTKVICGHCCEPMAIPSKAILQSQLSALQGLVRAYGEAKVAFDEGRLREDHHAWKERFNKLELAEAALIDYTMRTLDATTLYGGEANAANENE